MTTDEISGKPQVPVGELEELVEEWRECSEHDIENGYEDAAGTWAVASRDLEVLIERYDYE